jgi:iron transport multicopper oxidase
MLSRLFLLPALLLPLLPVQVHSLAPTDEIQDAVCTVLIPGPREKLTCWAQDPPQTGYLPDHNIDPSIVGSPSFRILWKNPHNAKERFYAKPLLYTPPGKSQLVFLASSMNIVRTVDAVTGKPINSRTLQPPFLASDTGCSDIPDFVGIIGTPVIDPDSDTVYFFSKGYANGASSGGIVNGWWHGNLSIYIIDCVSAGRFKLYALDINTLQDKPGFPVDIDGHSAVNDPQKYV